MFRVNVKLTKWFDIETGVRHGCVKSPWLFMCFIDGVLIEVSESNRVLNIVKGATLLWLIMPF